jgi:hypothetical protein
MTGSNDCNSHLVTSLSEIVADLPSFHRIRQAGLLLTLTPFSFLSASEGSATQRIPADCDLAGLGRGR